MNARLMKEARDVLPILGGLVLVIAVPCLIWRADAAAGIGGITFATACAVLAGAAFGNEFQQRTISLLLSQPIPRSALWWDKMLVLGSGMLVCLGVLAACLVFSPSGGDRSAPLILALVALCAFCGGPYWTLVLRTGIGGMVAAAAVPAWILVLTAYVARQFTEDDDAAVMYAPIPILLYCGIVFWLGYRKFQRLQVLDGASRELTLPAGWEAAIARPFTSVASRFRGPYASLLKKELRLQQVSLLLAGVFAVTAVAGFGVYLRYHNLGVGILAGDFMIYLAILPLIAGAISIAEERGWGVSEWHLTLPPSARQQWSAKMLATLSTSLALGQALPAAMFLAGSALTGNLRGDLSDLSEKAVEVVSQVLLWILGSLLVTSVAVYAASASKNTVRAILGAIAIIVASWPVFGLANTSAEHVTGWMGFPGPRWATSPALSVCLAGLVVMFCVTQWLAWSNFRRTVLTGRRFILQLVVLVFALWLVSLAVSFSMQLGDTQ
jgi:hypothetical protein